MMIFQIYYHQMIMNVNDYVKEKAMQKLKEVKSKSDDSCSKARQYLEGLLKIPFNIYKKEYIFNIKEEVNSLYSKIIEILDNINSNKYIMSNNVKNLLNYKDFDDIYIKFINENRNNKNINTIYIYNLIQYFDNKLKIDNIIIDDIILYIDKIKKQNLVKYLNIIYNNDNNDKNNTIVKHHTFTLKSNCNNLKNILIDYITNNKQDREKIKFVINVIYNNINNNNINNNNINNCEKKKK